MEQERGRLIYVENKLVGTSAWGSVRVGGSVQTRV